MTKKDDEVSVKTTDTPTDLENVKTLDKIIVTTNGNNRRLL